jgi:hypothetical protein
MFKYRKKPVVIEAYRIILGDNVDLHNTSTYPQWFAEACANGTIVVEDMDTMYIKTLEGPLHVSDGDWIIKGVKGELYPCKPDIFEATYDKVEE